MRFSLPTLCSVIFAVSLPPLAFAAGPYSADCASSKDPDRAIAACNRVVDGYERSTADDRVAAQYFRANAYLQKERS
jgi:hypothetical protein